MQPIRPTSCIEEFDAMVRKNTLIKTTAVTFGAAMATMYAAPELNADVVNLTANPGGYSFQTSLNNSVATNVVMTTTSAGAPVASFEQWNDSIGKTMFNFGALGVGGSFGLVQFSSSLNSNVSFGAATAVGFSAGASGTFYLGFKDVNGNAGWFAANMGGAGGAVTYLGGEYGRNGSTVHVGGTVPEPATFGLGLLAMGANWSTSSTQELKPLLLKNTKQPLTIMSAVFFLRQW